MRKAVAVGNVKAGLKEKLGIFHGTGGVPFWFYFVGDFVIVIADIFLAFPHTVVGRFTYVRCTRMQEK